MDLERRIRNLLDPMTGTGMSSSELLNRVVSRLVERLYFADFRVAEQTRLIGNHEVTQVVAIKAGPVIGSGLASIHRVELPETLDRALPHREGAPLDQAIWSLLNLVSVIDAAGQIPVENFIRPLYIVLSWGPVEYAGACTVQLLSDAERKPAWSIISGPTGSSFVENQPGLLRLLIKPNAKLRKEITAGLKGRYVREHSYPLFRGTIHPSNDATFQRILDYGDGTSGIHVARSVQTDVSRAAQIITSSSVDQDEGSVDVEDGTVLGPDQRVFFEVVDRGLARLKEQGVVAGVADFLSDDTEEDVAMYVHVQYQSRFDLATTMEVVVASFQGENGLGLDVELIYTVPPVLPGLSKDLGAAMDRLGVQPVQIPKCYVEAGWFSQKKIPSVIFGPGSLAHCGGVNVTDKELDESANLIEALLNELILSKNE